MTQPIRPLSASPAGRPLRQTSPGGAPVAAAEPAATVPPAPADVRMTSASPLAGPTDVDTAVPALPGRADRPRLVDGYREIVRNPRNVNGAPGHGADGPEAAIPVPDPVALGRALAALPADRRAQYEQVLAATRTDPAAQDALGQLAIRGQLVGGPPDRDGHDLLANLAGFASQAVQPPLDRSVVLGQLVQELADPGAINQHAANTCAVACGQIYLAQRDPAEYVRLMGGLASPAGQVKTRGGSLLEREPGTERPRDLRGGDNAGPDDRADTSRLFQGAAMELANSDEMDYDPVADMNTDRATGARSTNAPSGGPAILMAALTGRPTARVRPGREGEPTREAAMGQLEAALARGPQQVNVSFTANKQTFTHALLVQRMDATHVYYNNPWGTEERMSRDAFTQRALNLFLTT